MRCAHGLDLFCRSAWQGGVGSALMRPARQYGRYGVPAQEDPRPPRGGSVRESRKVRAGTGPDPSGPVARVVHVGTLTGSGCRPQSGRAGGAA